MFRKISSTLGIAERNLMIVAHPDDEIIFGGALLQEGNWKVICLTNGDNTTRCKEFQEVMNILGLDYEIWDYPDKWGGDFDRKSVREKLLPIIKDKYNKIVTHNEDGEYGHSQHIATNEIVMELVDENLFVFGKGDNFLPFDMIHRKFNLLKIYESQKGVADWVSKNGTKIMDYLLFEKIERIK
tara:strand:- start:968 stop:1519 length:552 start_codon:yes stop_codon:yes gene_type:complete